MLSRDRFIMAPTNKPFVITIVHMLLAQISGQCCAYDEYCVSDSNGYDPNYAYYGISDGCKYFKSVSSTNVLHRTSSNWILSSNIKDDSTSYRVCSQFHLDYCTEGTWTSPRGTSYPSMTVNKCTSTPSSTYPRAELIAIIIVAMVFLLGIIGTLLFLKRTYKKADHEGKEDLKIVVEAPGDINAHPNELKNVEGWGFTYQNVAPSAPVGDDDTIGEVEGLLCGRYDEIQKWFTSSVNLQADNQKYFEVFIDYGYDDMSLIKEMKETDLDTMGITKLAHKNRILNSIHLLK
eukprot:813694_1